MRKRRSGRAGEYAGLITPHHAGADPASVRPVALLTAHGTLLCADADGALEQRDCVDGVAHAADPATLPVEALARAPLVAIRSEGRYLRASEDRATVAFDRAQPNDHENFLPLTASDLAMLGGLLSHAWVRKSDASPIGPIAAEGARWTRPFTLALGKLALDLRAQVPFIGPALPLRVSIFPAGGGADELCLYRPLVLFTALGDDLALAQLGIALSSLVRVGLHDADIMVLTDRSRGDILAASPNVDPARLVVVPLRAADRTGRRAARYVLTDIALLQRYQPILYSDTDVVFDAPIAPMLRRIACADAIAAPLESWSPLASAHGVGAHLLGEFDVGTSLGFNSGTLGIPNLALHADTLRLVRRLILNRNAVFGRAHFAWVDQPILNYLHWRRGGVETATISRFVRWGVDGLPTRPDARSGLVHFWPPSRAADKLAAMRRYLDAIER